MINFNIFIMKHFSNSIINIIVFALSKSVVVSFLAFFVLGASDVISIVIRSTLV